MGERDANWRSKILVCFNHLLSVFNCTMDRTSFLQQLLDRRKRSSYLEIGVYRGCNFLKIRADRKFGIDPNFHISLRAKVSSLLKNPSNLRNQYYKMASNEFFADHSGYLPKEGLDIVFIDGLHTYAQALRDTEQSLSYLKADGVIVLHDCNPPHRAAATPANSVEEARALQVSGWNNQWCGDVWKVVLHLRSQRADLTVSVVDCDMGLGVVRRGTNPRLLSISADELKDLDYSDLERNRVEWLDLHSMSCLTDF